MTMDEKIMQRYEFNICRTLGFSDLYKLFNNDISLDMKDLTNRLIIVSLHNNEPKSKTIARVCAYTCIYFAGLNDSKKLTDFMNFVLYQNNVLDKTDWQNVMNLNTEELVYDDLSSVDCNY